MVLYCISNITILFIATFLLNLSYVVPQDQLADEFQEEKLVDQMYRVNEYFKETSWHNVDRNWKRGTYYTGLMAFYNVTGDSNLLRQAFNWGAKHSWQIGTEWNNPANRLCCSQTYLELYQIMRYPIMMEETKAFIDKRKLNPEHAFKQGWNYIDALFVGCSAIAMLGNITGDYDYYLYMNKLFREVTDSLIDRNENLFYRDTKAINERSRNNRKVLWSRGNGWVMASIPRILNYLPKDDPQYNDYIKLLRQMAEALNPRQFKDGFWRSNLADPDEYPMPESSGTALFTYALAWGINNGVLESDIYLPVVKKSWKELYNIVDEKGKVMWGQTVSRDPGPVYENDSDEYVSGAFLLAGSEVLKLILNTE